MLRGEQLSNLWGEKASLGPGTVDPRLGCVNINEVMFRSTIFRLVRASGEFEVGELDDVGAQYRNTKIQDDLSEALKPRSIFVSLPLDLKRGPSESLRLGRTLCMRYF